MAFADYTIAIEYSSCRETSGAKPLAALIRSSCKAPRSHNEGTTMLSKSLLTRILVACLFAVVGADAAHAYYAPQSGRFISRDPIVYPDGANTYAAWYVPAKVDPNGTAKLSTGLKRCYGTLHGYVKLSDGVGYGYYAESHTHGGATFWDDISTAGVVDGVVKNDDAQVYSTATCYNVVLDDTCWDLVCYRRTVEAWVRNQYSLYGGGGGNYNVLLSNCYVFQNMALGLHPFVGPDLSACRKNTWCCLLYGDTTIGLGTASP